MYKSTSTKQHITILHKKLQRTGILRQENLNVSMVSELTKFKICQKFPRSALKSCASLYQAYILQRGMSGNDSLPQVKYTDN